MNFLLFEMGGGAAFCRAPRPILYFLVYLFCVVCCVACCIACRVVALSAALPAAWWRCLPRGGVACEGRPSAPPTPTGIPLAPRPTPRDYQKNDLLLIAKGAFLRKTQKLSELGLGTTKI